DGEFEELHGFTGKEYDPDIGLYYFNARWYDPDLGRFISEDPAGDPNNPNLYSYCGNNPLNRIDPSGKVWWWLVSAIISGLDSYLCGGDFFQGFAMGAVTGAIGAGVGSALGETAWGAALAETSKVGFGATSGAIAGGITGEMVGEGFEKGAVYGAIGGAINAGIDKHGEYASNNWFNEALLDGLKDGVASYINGGEFDGDFTEGFWHGFGGSASKSFAGGMNDFFFKYLKINDNWFNHAFISGLSSGISSSVFGGGISNFTNGFWGGFGGSTSNSINTSMNKQFKDFCIKSWYNQALVSGVSSGISTSIFKGGISNFTNGFWQGAGKSTFRSLEKGAYRDFEDFCNKRWYNQATVDGLIGGVTATFNGGISQFENGFVQAFGDSAQKALNASLVKIGNDAKNWLNVHFGTNF
ncbi:MAG: RHS repeat-associated core domain-containing protein, partial [Firmicutes bacterium]|nr:RHS repeat-associated core domain-containing protein [Bacillota bacterium]